MVNAIPWPRRIIYLPPILPDMYRRVHAHRHCCIFPYGGNAIGQWVQDRACCLAINHWLDEREGERGKSR